MSKVTGSLFKILRDKPTVITRASLWRIPHNSDVEDVRLKVGRYKKPKDWREDEELETLVPKSELTFDQEEFQSLLNFLQENYEPFKSGVKAYIPVDKPFSKDTADQLRKFLATPDRRNLMRFLADQDLVPADVVGGLEQIRRAAAVREFEEMLLHNYREAKWQDWFEQNSWVLGSEFVRVLDERRIDVQNISDFLMEAYDGFLDVVEIKRPDGGMHFWAAAQDHGNYIPSTDLTKAISQAASYIFEVEREADSVKFQERVGGIRTVKPRGILVFGRSDTWNKDQEQAYRILNSSYHSLSIMTYDHVLMRAKRMIGVGL